MNHCATTGVLATLRVARRPAARATVATIACDSGLRYLRTGTFRPDADA